MYTEEGGMRALALLRELTGYPKMRTTTLHVEVNDERFGLLEFLCGLKLARCVASGVNHSVFSPTAAGVALVIELAWYR